MLEEGHVISEGLGIALSSGITTMDMGIGNAGGSE